MFIYIYASPYNPNCPNLWIIPQQNDCQWLHTPYCDVWTTSIYNLLPGPSQYHSQSGWRMRAPGEKEEISQEEGHFWTWAAGISRRQTSSNPPPGLAQSMIFAFFHVLFHQKMENLWGIPIEYPLVIRPSKILRLDQDFPPRLGGVPQPKPELPRPTDFSLHKPKNVEQLGRNMDTEMDVYVTSLDVISIIDI